MKRLLLVLLLSTFNFTSVGFIRAAQRATSGPPSVSLASSMLVSLFTVPAQAQDKPQGAVIAFESTEYDFGDIPHSSPRVECRFAFTNEGTVPLVVTKTLTSCSCVKVSYGKKPVPPGGKGEIVVTYEVNKKESGVFYKVIEIYSNATEKRSNLIVKGNAIKSLRP